MTLTIRNPKADQLARELARTLGVTITQAVRIALREKWKIMQWRKQASEMMRRL